MVRKAKTNSNAVKRPVDAVQRRGDRTNYILMGVYSAVILFGLVVPVVRGVLRLHEMLTSPEGVRVLAEAKASGEPLIDAGDVRFLVILGLWLLFMATPAFVAIVNLVSVIRRQMNYARVSVPGYMERLLDGEADEQSTRTLRRIIDELELVTVKCPNCGDKVVTSPDSTPKCPSCMERFDASTAERVFAGVTNVSQKIADRVTQSVQSVPHGAPAGAPAVPGVSPANVPAPGPVAAASGFSGAPQPPAAPSPMGVPLPPRPQPGGGVRSAGDVQVLVTCPNCGDITVVSVDDARPRCRDCGLPLPPDAVRQAYQTHRTGSVIRACDMCMAPVEVIPGTVATCPRCGWAVKG
ncbi:hypothetical protein Uis4E_2094 [Bifidobacterium parmae]|uniref:Uncharacterized protein n=2 Tax=Bifidobacterium parmae TaxID=361854 RepID=A0A2N5IW41_9BIFI|nr:hypothetical protein Uis4E_2094 [Bifidobacterium parmae]